MTAATARIRSGASLRRTVALALVALLMGLAGCAAAPGGNPRDPWEPMNRATFELNESLDTVILKPAAVAYKTVTPGLVRAGVTNFFNNVGDAWSLVNNLLQFKPRASIETYFRINVNTILGLGGLLDIATDIGLEPRKEDLGQTFGYWGLPSGPYLVLPFFGPSTLRDAIATPADTFGYPVSLVHRVALRNTLIVVDTVNKRANLLRAGEMLDESALDKYTFSRDVFLQKRRNDIFDGTPPPEDEADAEPQASPEKP